MAKFKVGDRVKILLDGTYGTIDVILDGDSCGVIKSGEKIGRYYPSCYLELVEPKEGFSIHGKILSYGEYYYIRREDTSFRELGYLNTYRDDGIQAIMTFTPVENKLHIPLNHIHRLYTQEEMSEQITKDKIKKAFERPMISDELAKQIAETFKEAMGKNDFNTILLPKSLYDVLSPHLLKPQPPKNRIPDRVVFNQDKGKVTVLISKHLDGVAPYWSYTSKVHVESGDKFDAQFGFLLSYYKYLIRRFDLKVQKEMIERIFKILKERRYVYLLGVVENEVLKINGVESYKDWEDIYLAITDPSNAKNVYDYTWDYLEWKEMLRVHELETKREEQKAIRKEIKKHEQEIEKLKKKGV